MENIKKFNIFKVAGIPQSEEIHTRIIAELINPHSKFHNNGLLFLNIFIESIGLWKNPNFPQSTTVRTEVKTFTGRRIDMVISNERLYIPFEVKIWANDQPNQLADYYEFAETQHRNVPVIVYLTPFGYRPSLQSQGNVPENKIHCVSFYYQIVPWLDECIKTDCSQDLLEIMKQLRDNIADKFRKEVVIDQNDDDDGLLDVIHKKLTAFEITLTECVPKKYITFTLSKKDRLEFALRLQRESKYKIKLLILCGVWREDGKLDYGAKAVAYTREHVNEFVELYDDTFIDTWITEPSIIEPLPVSIIAGVWARYESNFDWLGGEDIERFAEKCFDGVDYVFVRLKEHIRIKLKHLNQQ